MEAGRRKAIERRKRDAAQLRAAVLKMLRAGHTQSEIARSLGKQRQTIYRVVKRLRDAGEV